MVVVMLFAESLAKQRPGLHPKVAGGTVGHCRCSRDGSSRQSDGNHGTGGDQ
jgi:hypothetical protein